MLAVTRKGPFWAAVEGKAPLPSAAVTLGWELVAINSARRITAFRWPVIFGGKGFWPKFRDGNDSFWALCGLCGGLPLGHPPLQPAPSGRAEVSGGRTAAAEHSSSVEPPMARGYGRVPARCGPDTRR
jgi:hypothetical protein